MAASSNATPAKIPASSAGERRAIRLSVDARVHRANVIDRQFGIGRAHQLSQRLGERFRTLARARDDENTGVVAISVRQVNRALSLRFGERGLFHRADDADNVNSFASSFSSPSAIALTERAAVRPVTPGQIFVHHTDAFRAMRICRGEEASFAQRNAEGREVIAVNGIGIMAVDRLTRRWHIALRCDCGFAAVAAQRNVRDRSGGDDSRLLADGFEQAIDDADSLRLQIP